MLVSKQLSIEGCVAMNRRQLKRLFSDHGFTYNPDRHVATYNWGDDDLVFYLNGYGSLGRQMRHAWEAFHATKTSSRAYMVIDWAVMDLCRDLNNIKEA